MRSTKLLSWTKRLLGIDARPVPPHVFAVDGTRLRYGCFARHGERFHCSAYQICDLPADTFQAGPLGGPMRDSEAFGELLGEFLQGMSEPLQQASLVIPDPWLRLVFTELTEIPTNGQAQDEVLRWKLRRLQPFRVDDLRVKGVEVTPLPEQEEPRRVLLGFSMELLLSQLEQAFTSHGIRLGQIQSASLALTGAVSPSQAQLDAMGSQQRQVVEGALSGTVLVQEDGYTLVFHHLGEPVLHRHKEMNGALDDSVMGTMVTRDLKLTRTFVEEKLPDLLLERVLVAAPAERESAWVGWLSQGLEAAVEPLDWEHLPVAPLPLDAAPSEGDAAHVPWAPWHEIGPLLGAACQEVM